MIDKTAAIREAQKHLSKGQIDKAILEWEKIVQDYPDGNTFNVIGDLYLKNSNKKNSIDSYHKAANFFRHEGFSLKALALYKKVLNINPSDPDALYALGELNEEKGLQTDAIKYYLAAADSLTKEGKKDRILDTYEKILSISPANAPLRTRIADIYLKEGLLLDAAKEFSLIARLHDEKGELEKAREFYQKTLDIQPRNKDAILGICTILERAEDIAGAVDFIDKAAGLLPDDAEILFRRAGLSFRLGRFDDAKMSLARIIELSPEQIPARRFLAEILLKEGLREKAWTEYQPVIDDLTRNGLYEDAARLLEDFREIDPVETSKRLVSIYRNLGDARRVAANLSALGEVLLERGLEREAELCYREAADTAPDDPELKRKLAAFVREPEKPAQAEHIVLRVGKPPDEIFTEADIFSRYGLVHEALKLLEDLKLRDPGNKEIHLRLRSLYLDADDHESYITECLTLADLFRSEGDGEAAARVIDEAYGVNPLDPRLPERQVLGSAGGASYEQHGGLQEAAPAGEPSVEDYDEQLAEADFYARQGLTQEAVKILERLRVTLPDNTEVRDRLSSLGETPAVPEAAGMGEHAEQVEEQTAAPDGVFDGQKETEPLYEDLSFGELDPVEAGEMPEPTLESDVLEIFHEFKKGLERELGDEDYETHYNLGIAYKEMGLIDDAITEFQRAKNDPKRVVQSSSMLGICYMDKGLFSLAIDTLKEALSKMPEKDEAYRALQYDLADACGRNNSLSEALSLFTEVYAWNANFRNVFDRISEIRERIGRTGQPRQREKKDRVSYL